MYTQKAGGNGHLIASTYIYWVSSYCSHLTSHPMHRWFCLWPTNRPLWALCYCCAWGWPLEKCSVFSAAGIPRQNVVFATCAIAQTWSVFRGFNHWVNLTPPPRSFFSLCIMVSQHFLFFFVVTPAAHVGVWMVVHFFAVHNNLLVLGRLFSRRSRWRVCGGPALLPTRTPARLL